jgi:Calcineurin-like phosphoesterase
VRTLRPVFALALAALAIATSAGAGAASAERAVDPFVVAAGDIACPPPSSARPALRSAAACHEDATASMFAAGGRLSGRNLRAILPLGDLQYNDGRLDEYSYRNAACSIVPPYGTGVCSFDASWTAAASRASRGLPDVPVYPTPGNHEYQLGDESCRLAKRTPSGLSYDACGYNEYFGNDVAVPRPGAGGDGRGSYFVRFDSGSAHPMLFVSLNVGRCEHDETRCAEGSRMLAFLRETLISPDVNPGPGCVVVYYHQAAWDAFDHGDLPYVAPVWRAMLAPDVPRQQRPDLVVNGHDHVYERFPPLDENGIAGSGAAAIPEIVVGTGGRDVGHLPSVSPASAASPPAAFDATHFGVEKISWSPSHGRITASFHRQGDPVPFDPMTYRCRGAAAIPP